MRSNMPRLESLGRDKDSAELIGLRSHERKIANIVTAVDIMLGRCKETDILAD
jgi:hypothetical protein